MIINLTLQLSTWLGWSEGKKYKFRREISYFSLARKEIGFSMSCRPVLLGVCLMGHIKDCVGWRKNVRVDYNGKRCSWCFSFFIYLFSAFSRPIFLSFHFLHVYTSFVFVSLRVWQDFPCANIYLHDGNNCSVSLCVISLGSSHHLELITWSFTISLLWENTQKKP